MSNVKITISWVRNYENFCNFWCCLCIKRSSLNLQVVVERLLQLGFNAYVCADCNWITFVLTIMLAWTIFVTCEVVLKVFRGKFGRVLPSKEGDVAVWPMYCFWQRSIWKIRSEYSSPRPAPEIVLSYVKYSTLHIPVWRAFKLWLKCRIGTDVSLPCLLLTLNPKKFF